MISKQGLRQENWFVWALASYQFLATRRLEICKEIQQLIRSNSLYKSSLPKASNFIRTPLKEQPGVQRRGV